jgi:hypothetical protein
VQSPKIYIYIYKTRMGADWKTIDN